MILLHQNNRVFYKKHSPARPGECFLLSKKDYLRFLAAFRFGAALRFAGFLAAFRFGAALRFAGRLAAFFFAAICVF